MQLFILAMLNYKIHKPRHFVKMMNIIKKVKVYRLLGFLQFFEADMSLERIYTLYTSFWILHMKMS